MNPNGVNPDSQQNTNLGQSSPGVLASNNTAPVTPTPTPVQATTTQTTLNPAPAQSVQNNTVAPAASTQSVQNDNAASTLPTIEEVVLTPMPTMQQTVATPSTPTPTPMPATPETSVEAPKPMPTDPNAEVKHINLSSVPTPEPTQQEAPPSASNEPVVIKTTRSKGSNFVLILIIIILIAFVFNIDTVLVYIDNYMQTGSLTGADLPSDNLTNGFVLINEAASTIKVNNIKFHNFKKGESMTISFNYESTEGYSDPTSLGIYIELYGSDKNLVYKELFNPNGGIEKNTTVNYSMSLESDVYDKAYYALARTYTDEEKNATSSITCKYTDSNYKYENKYNFVASSLESYDVIKESLGDQAEIEAEYNSIKDKVGASYANGKLTYSVNLNNQINDFSPIYKKGLTPQILKNREELKKWICE